MRRTGPFLLQGPFHVTTDAGGELSWFVLDLILMFLYVLDTWLVMILVLAGGPPLLVRMSGMRAAGSGISQT